MADTLKNVSLKKTHQREMILEIFNNNENPLSAEDVYLNVSRNGVNLSTVYRALGALSEKGILNKVLGNNRKTYYSLCNHEGCHHHHLICSICNEITELELCPIENVYASLEKQTGYKIMSHTLELTGICSKCSNQH